MKNLLLISLLISSNLLGQSNFTLDKDTRIYDIPGGDFLTALIVNDKTYIKHFDSAGILLWEDSLVFAPSLSPVYLNEITQFKNTNEFIINTFADPTPGTLFWYSNENDTLVYQFTKLNLSTHTFNAQVVDTFIGKSIDLLEINDTSIYVLVPDYSISNVLFNIRTYSINPSMNVSTIAPLDSVQTSAIWGSRFVFENNIYFHQSDEGHHSIKKYSTQMSYLQINNQNTLAGMDYNTSFYQKPLNSDSMLIFTEGITVFQSWVTKWRMDWVDLSLTPINSSVFNSPATDQFPAVYSSWFNNSAIDRTNRKIIVLTKDESPTPTTIQPKVFIYDFDFNLICEFPSIIGNQNENHLIELNGLVYLRNNNSLNTSLTLIDCSALNLNEIVTDNDFEIYPNPCNSIVNLSNPKQKNLSISLKSSEGKVVSNYSTHETSVILNLDHIPEGIYFLQINDGTNNFVKRLIKN